MSHGETAITSENFVAHMPHYTSHCTEQLFVLLTSSPPPSHTTLDLQAQQKLNLLTIEESCTGPSHAVTWTVTYRRMFMPRVRLQPGSQAPQLTVKPLGQEADFKSGKLRTPPLRKLSRSSIRPSLSSRWRTSHEGKKRGGFMVSWNKFSYFNFFHGYKCAM